MLLAKLAKPSSLHKGGNLQHCTATVPLTRGHPSHVTTSDWCQGCHISRRPQHLVRGQPQTPVRTSALYIFTNPLLTLDHSGTPLMFHSWFECSAKGPLLTCRQQWVPCKVLRTEGVKLGKETAVSHNYLMNILYTAKKHVVIGKWCTDVWIWKWLWVQLRVICKPENDKLVLPLPQLPRGKQDATWFVVELFPGYHHTVFTYELCTAPYKRDKMMVIQRPDSLTASRLHTIRQLQLPYQF